jgi:hypothetical protein
MSPFLLPLLSIGEKLIDKFFVTPEEKARAQYELLKLEQEGEFKKILGQLEINAKEAAHPSIFVAGWRPFVGWTCGVGLAYQAIFYNLLQWVAVAKGWPLPPAPDTETLLYILGGLLGLGTLRTYEKKSGVTK